MTMMFGVERTFDDTLHWWHRLVGCSLLGLHEGRSPEKIDTAARGLSKRTTAAGWRAGAQNPALTANLPIKENKHPVWHKGKKKLKMCRMILYQTIS